MIARLRGTLEEKNASSVVVAAGGVGYEVFIPLSTFYNLPEVGAEVSLYVKTVVREDAFELFGFLSREEKEAFLLLNSVSRVGPRLAQSILSGLTPADLVEAVTGDNPARLSGAPGVGAKTAQRLVMELKDKVAHLAALLPDKRPAAVEMEPEDGVSRDVISALQNLGYTKGEAEKAVALARQEDGGDDLSALLRLSLRHLRKA